VNGSLLLALGVVFFAALLGETPSPPTRLQGVTLDARRDPGETTLARLDSLGFTHVTVIPYAFQPGLHTPEVRYHSGDGWYSESDRGIRELSRHLRARGMHLILKPQLWLRGGAWTADIDFDREEDWRAWEADYQAFMMHFAHLAEEVRAPLLVIGTELGTPVRKREAFWRKLITDIRAVYHGKLTYAANWHEDFERVPFWDALDYVGVQGYFPLTDDPDPTLGVLRAAWKPHRTALERIHERTGLPVLITELGYRSVHYAAAEPWRWPTREEYGHLQPDFQLQARLYQAFFETFWAEPWLAGIIIWKWHPENNGPERRRELNFTPQNKPAEQVIRRWFGGEV